jgi:hypothetical protein
VIDSLGEKLGFGDEELEWLKAANTERDRIFAEMGAVDGCGFDPHTFRGGFGSFLSKRGFPHGRGGFPGHRGFHNHNHKYGHDSKKDE